MLPVWVRPSDRDARMLFAQGSLLTDTSSMLRMGHANPNSAGGRVNFGSAPTRDHSVGEPSQWGFGAPLSPSAIPPGSAPAGFGGHRPLFSRLLFHAGSQPTTPTGAGVGLNGPASGPQHPFHSATHR